MTFFDWLDRWLAVYVKPSVKNITFSRYASIVKVRIKPALGALRVEELTTPVLQEFISQLPERYSANSIKLTCFVIKSALTCAAEEGIIKPLKKLRCPKAREKKVECFSKQEQAKLEEFVMHSPQIKYCGILLTLYTGLRIGELLALEWSDIDFKNGFLQVTKTCYDSWVDGQYVKATDAPKTDSACRIIPVPPPILKVLASVQKRSKSRYVVSRNSGENVSCRGYQFNFGSVLKKLGIPHRGFHSLRHTFATRAIECGVDVKTLSEIMGHSNPVITLKRYTHSMMEHKEEMMQRIGKMFKTGEHGRKRP